MASKITAYKSYDGTLFTSQKEATAHEISKIRGENIAALTCDMDDEDNWFKDWLHDHADDIIAALTVKLDTRTRKPKAAAEPDAA